MHKFFYYISISYETVIMCKKNSTFHYQNDIDQQHYFFESILCTIPFTKLKLNKIYFKKLNIFWDYD